MITIEQIRAARAILGLKQSDLAKKAGISISTLNNIERRIQTDPKISTLHAIQRALEIEGVRFLENENGEIGVFLNPNRLSKGKKKKSALDHTSMYRAWLLDVLASVYTTRSKLLALVAAPNAKTQVGLVEQVKATAEDVNNKVASLLVHPQLSADVKGKLNDFNLVWMEFQHTRNTQIIPAIFAGDKNEAETMLYGIQAERLKKMTLLLQ